jgi:uracil permease
MLFLTKFIVVSKYTSLSHYAINTKGRNKEMGDYSFRGTDSLLGAQMLFVAFGALVLVPVITGLDPSVALFTAGIGTLIFQITTKGKVPVFLASSFAFIAPIIYGVQTWGIPATMGGLASAGLFYVFLSYFIKVKGVEIVHKIFPPVVTGPVIMVIGLILAPVGIFMARGLTGDGAAILVPETKALIISMSTLVIAIAVAVSANKKMRIIPIMIAIVAGYLISLPFGLIDFSKVISAPWIHVPGFTFPEFNINAIIFILPVAIAPAIEHFGDIIAIGSVTGRDYLEDPGVDKTLLGDGLATSVASLLGGPPNTTYSEVTGAVALTKTVNPGIMTWAALFAIVFAFIGKLNALLSTIPTPVMGGILILLFGLIVTLGIRSIVQGNVDFNKPRNMIIVAVPLVFGIGGMSFGPSSFAVKGIALAAISAVLLNLILPEGED